MTISEYISISEYTFCIVQALEFIPTPKRLWCPILFVLGTNGVAVLQPEVDPRVIPRPVASIQNETMAS